MFSSRWTVGIVVLGLLATMGVREPVQPTTWITASEPVLILGDGSGPTASLLVEVDAALVLPNGSILVSDCGSVELKLYSSRGEFVGVVGKRGQGPAEFQRLNGMFRGQGDSILVSDSRLARISVYAPDGLFARAVPAAEGHRATGSAVAYGQFPDGSLMMVRSVGVRLPGGVRDQPDRFVMVERWNNSGQIIDTLTRTYTFSDDSVSASGDTLSRRVYVASRGASYHIGADDRTELREYSLAGQLLRTISGIGRVDPVTDAFKDRFIGAHLDAVPDSLRTRLRDLLIQRGFRRTFPAFGRLLQGRDGTLWVQDPNRGEQNPHVWTAIRDSRPAARAYLPRRFDAVDFGPDWVLGVFRDADDVTTVRLLRLIPGSVASDADEQVAESTIASGRTCVQRL